MNLKFKFKLLSAGILFMLAFPLFATLGLGEDFPLKLHKKNIPAMTFNNLFPPYKDYEYFQNPENCSI